MESIIEKILNSKRSSIEQKSYFTLVISKIPNDNEKIKFLLTLIEKTLPGLSEDQVFSSSFNIC